MKKSLMLRKGGAKVGPKLRQLQPGKRERRYLLNQERELRSPQPLPDLSLPLIFSNVARSRSTARRQTDRFSPTLRSSSKPVAPRVVVSEAGMVPTSNVRRYKGNAMIKTETLKKAGMIGVLGSAGGYLILRSLGLSDEVGNALQGVLSHTTGETYRGIPISWIGTLGLASAVVGFASRDLVSTFFWQCATKVLTFGAFAARGVALALQSTGGLLDWIGIRAGYVAGYLTNHDFSRKTMGTNPFTCRWLVGGARELERSIADKWQQRESEDSRNGDIDEPTRGVRSHGFQQFVGHFAAACVILVGSWFVYNAKTGANLPETLAAGYHKVLHHNTAVAEEAKDESAAGQAAGQAQTKDADKALETANIEAAPAKTSGGAS